MLRGIGTVALGLLLVSMTTAGEGIQGEYLEARNADVWTGACFANGEIGIVGDKAVMAWKVTHGEFNNVSLDGLSVIAVVVGNDTFGINRPVETKALLIVDAAGTPEQQAAMVAMARKLAGDTIQTVVGVRVDDIKMTTAYCEGKGCASVESKIVNVKTRCLHSGDVVCSNEVLYYPPLAKVHNEYAAYSLRNEYKGKELGTTFADNGARSAVIAQFSL